MRQSGSINDRITATKRPVGHSWNSTKVADWLQAGAQLVIVVDPGRCSAEMHTSMNGMVRIDIDGILDAGDVIPGWTLPLRDLFVP